VVGLAIPGERMRDVSFDLLFHHPTTSPPHHPKAKQACKPDSVASLQRRWSFLCRDACAPRDRSRCQLRQQPTRRLAGPGHRLLLGLAPDGGYHRTAEADGFAARVRPGRRPKPLARAAPFHFHHGEAVISASLWPCPAARLAPCVIAVSDRPVLWCPDFPHRRAPATARPSGPLRLHYNE